MYNLMKDHQKKFNRLKNLVLRTKNNKEPKQEVLINAGNVYNKLYYIYKDKYTKKINSLSAEDKKKFDYKKLRLTDDYQYPSEEEQEEIQEEKEETKTDMNKFSKYIAEEEAHINKELFIKYFNYQNPVMLNHLYETNDINNNNKLVSAIFSGIKDLKKEIKEMSKEEKEN